MAEDDKRKEPDLVQTRFTLATSPGAVRKLWATVKSGGFERMLAIVQRKDHWHVAGIGLDMEGAWRSLWLGTRMVERAEKADYVPSIQTFEVPHRPHPERSGPPRNPEVKRKDDGELVAPDGETFLFCGECQATKFYVTDLIRTGLPRRFICCVCGNEIKLLMSDVDFPASGRA